MPAGTVIRGIYSTFGYTMSNIAVVAAIHVFNQIVLANMVCCSKFQSFYLL